MSKVIVIGGGAAGLVAAAFASKNGNDVLIVEKNKKTGRKLAITGKGRCNVTNYCDVETFIKNITKNPKFLYSAITNFTPKDTYDFFESLGVKLKIERGQRVFPESDRALDICDALYKNCIDNGTRIVNEKVVAVLSTDSRIIGVKLANGDKIICDKVIICTGGLSYPLTGSTGDGYTFAKILGHNVTEILPSLVPLESDDWYCKELQGLSLKNCGLKVFDNINNKIVYKDFGEMLFTHFGLSGPMILSASAHMRNINVSKYTIYIDLKPALGLDKLDNRLLKDLSLYHNKDIINSLDDLLPKSIIPVIIKRCKIDEHIKSNIITKEQRKSLVEIIKNFSVSIKNFRTIDESIITSGGIDVKEINPKTMESKIVNGLFFAGEVIDVDAYTGGFNLQIAFSTGKLAGESV